MTMARPILLFFVVFLSLQALSRQVHAFEYHVGGPKGWSVPQPNDTRLYNTWASQNRFQLGDTLRFEYKRDSVLEVSEEDYNKCNSSHPNFFSNTGNTVFKLDHHGSFYFISGVSGHCEKGQHIIVKVKTSEESPSDGHKSSAGSLVVSPRGVVFMVFLSFVCFFCRLETSL